MAKETSTTNTTPGNRMRLADSTSTKDGATLHTYGQFSEDRGGKVETTEVVHQGKVVGRYVQHDGKTIETEASPDSQLSGLHDKIAKKIGAGDDISHTTPEATAEIAHQNQVGAEENEVEKAKTDPGKTKEVKPKDPKEGKVDSSLSKLAKLTSILKGALKKPEAMEKAMGSMNYRTGKDSEQYVSRGAAPKAPQITAPTAKVPKPVAIPNPKAPRTPGLNISGMSGVSLGGGAAMGKAEIPTVKKPPMVADYSDKASPSVYPQGSGPVQGPKPVVPKWKQNRMESQEAARAKAPGTFKNSKGTWMVKSETMKKWSAMMDSMRGFKAPLAKEDNNDKYWAAVTKQGRQQHAKTIPSPTKATPEQAAEMATKRDAMLAKKPAESATSNVAERPAVVARPRPTLRVVKSEPQMAQKAPTIQNATEQTIGVPNQPRDSGVAASSEPLDKAPTSTKKEPPKNPVEIKNLPSFENGLEAHLQHMNNDLSSYQRPLSVGAKKESYSGVPAPERNKKMSGFQRTLNYIKSGIKGAKIAIMARDSKSPDWSKLIGTSNPKVNQSGAVTLGNTLPGHNCPARGDCGSGGCYGMNGQQSMGNAWELRAYNSGLIQRPDFAKGAIHALENAPKKMNVDLDQESFDQIKDHPYFKQRLLSTPKIVNKTVKGVTSKVVRFKVKADSARWHDTGDIINQKHADDMYEIMKAFPEKRFYAYTKSLHLDLSKLRSLPNFHLIQSVGGAHDDKIDPNLPHTKYFPDIESAKAEGYAPVWHNDMAALMGIKKIGLIPHGARKGEMIQNELTNKKKLLGKSESFSKLPNWVKFDQPDLPAQEAAKGSGGKMAAFFMHSDGLGGQSLDKAGKWPVPGLVPPSGQKGTGGQHTLAKMAGPMALSQDRPAGTEFLSKPPVSEAQRKAMWAAASGHSTLGIPKKVGKEFADADKGGKLPEKKLDKGDVVDMKTMREANKAFRDHNPPKPAKPAVDTRTRAEKFDAMMRTHGQFKGAQYKQDKTELPGGGQMGEFGRGGRETYNNEPDANAPTARQRFEERLAGKTQRDKRNAKDVRAEQLFEKIHGPAVSSYRRKMDAFLGQDTPKSEAMRVPGSDRTVSYHGQDEAGNHYFSSSNRRGGSQSFVYSPGSKAPERIPGHVQSSHLSEWPWNSTAPDAMTNDGGQVELSDEGAAQKYGKNEALWGKKGVGAALSAIKQHPKFIELSGRKTKNVAAQGNEISPKDFEAPHKSSYSGETIARRKHGKGKGRSFSYGNSETGSYHPTWVRNPEDENEHKQVFHAVVKPYLDKLPEHAGKPATYGGPKPKQLDDESPAKKPIPSYLSVAKSESLVKGDVVDLKTKKVTSSVPTDKPSPPTGFQTPGAQKISKKLGEMKVEPKEGQKATVVNAHLTPPGVTMNEWGYRTGLPTAEQDFEDMRHRKGKYAPANPNEIRPHVQQMVDTLYAKGSVPKKQNPFDRLRLGKEIDNVKKSEALAAGKTAKDFTPDENLAIMRGTPMEAKEHGTGKGTSTAADHVVEHGAKYYSNEGLPAMESKLKNLQKAAQNHINSLKKAGKWPVPGEVPPSGDDGSLEKLKWPVPGEVPPSGTEGSLEKSKWSVPGEVPPSGNSTHMEKAAKPMTPSEFHDRPVPFGSMQNMTSQDHAQQAHLHRQAADKYATDPAMRQGKRHEEIAHSIAYHQNNAQQYENAAKQLAHQADANSMKKCSIESKAVTMLKKAKLSEKKPMVDAGLKKVQPNLQKNSKMDALQSGMDQAFGSATPPPPPPPPPSASGGPDLNASKANAFVNGLNKSSDEGPKAPAVDQQLYVHGGGNNSHVFWPYHKPTLDEHVAKYDKVNHTVYPTRVEKDPEGKPFYSALIRHWGNE